ncbi:hypothetical protein J6590_104230 [Homalodisca vitripennis]|nr:hypothetical protein J6590_104230 [Homalodisca vitripennis]
MPNLNYVVNVSPTLARTADAYVTNYPSYIHRYISRGTVHAKLHTVTWRVDFEDELLPFVFNGVIVTGGEKKWGWRGPSCQLEIARVLE